MILFALEVLSKLMDTIFSITKFDLQIKIFGNFKLRNVNIKQVVPSTFPPDVVSN